MRPVPSPAGSHSTGPASARRLAALLLVGVACLSAGTTCVGDEPPSAGVRTRNIIRKKLPKDVKSIALEYTVALIDENGNEKPVDPVEHTFKVGDSFLVKIRPQDDMYIYIFNEGPEGDRICLVPSRDEKPFFARKDAEIVLPDDGGYFAFNPPAGEEKFLVVAVPEPTDDVRLLATAVFKGQSGTLKTEADKTRNAAAEAAAARSIRERAASGIVKRGPSAAVVPRADAPLPADARVTNVEPPGDGEPSSFGLSISGPAAGPPELILDIPLRSKGTR